MTTLLPIGTPKPTVRVASWRKSTRSSNGSAQCVEVGAWRKSARSPSNGGNCVEAGTCSCHGIAVRDSKAPAIGTLSLTPTDWAALLTTLKTSPSRRLQLP